MRRIILLVIGGTLLVMMIIIVAVTQDLLSDSFARLERRYVERDVERVTNAIAEELSSLGRTANDWAMWDDTYGFVLDRNPRFIVENLDEVFFQNLRLSVVLFINTQGRMVFGRSFDLSRRVLADAPRELVSWLSARPDFWRFTDTNASAQGIIRLPQGPLLAVSRPIRNSLGLGPVRGAMLMGRFLDDREAAELAGRLAISLEVLPFESPRLEHKTADAVRAIAPGAPPYLDRSREDLVSAYAPIRDVDGLPIVALRVNAPRDIHLQAEKTMQYFYAWLLVIVVVFGAVMLIFIETRILSRLLRLSRGVLAVGTGGDPGRRVPAEGKDQIAYLGAAINGMLDALERSTEELRVSERRNVAFLDAVPDVIFRVTRDGTILDARSSAKLPLMETARDLVGKDAEQILSLYSFISPEYFDRSIAATEAALDTGIPQVLSYHVEVEGGRRYFEERFVASGETEAIVLVRDVTAQKKAEEIRDQEVLLKEIHHRVKNNLQVISSLLALQAGSTDDEKTRALLSESRDRVRSMALIHEKLYPSGDERGISFAGYVRDLAAHLRHSYAGNSGPVELGIDVEEMTLSMDVSVPCGLIINELLSNSLKYAFPGGRRGTISVSLHRVEGGRVVLTISDDGIGFPRGIDIRNPATLGLRIVNILVEQLRGALTMNPGSGASFTISFPSG
ncbi:MAG: CHASE4 domain-containing protein [Spirochaetia bacterium]|jgi:two-component sensor histidine kinase/sensor domain CHASE-containing protein